MEDNTIEMLHAAEQIRMSTVTMRASAWTASTQTASKAPAENFGEQDRPFGRAIPASVVVDGE